MNDDAHNPWRDGPRSPFSSAAFNHLSVQVAVGVAIGILLAFLAIWQIMEWRSRVAIEQAAQLLQQQLQQAQHEQQLQQQALRRSQLAEQQARIQRAQQLQRLAEAQAQQRLRLSQDRQDKEDAFRRAYIKPRECEDGGGADAVACANHFIRAKRAAEASGGHRDN